MQDTLVYFFLRSCLHKNFLNLSASISLGLGKAEKPCPIAMSKNNRRQLAHKLPNLIQKYLAGLKSLARIMSDFGEP